MVHLLTLRCDPPLDKEPSIEETKLAHRIATILKDFEAYQLEVEEEEERRVMEEEGRDWSGEEDRSSRENYLEKVRSYSEEELFRKKR